MKPLEAVSRSLIDRGAIPCEHCKLAMVPTVEQLRGVLDVLPPTRLAEVLADYRSARPPDKAPDTDQVRKHLSVTDVHSLGRWLGRGPWRGMGAHWILGDPKRSAYQQHLFRADSANAVLWLCRTGGDLFLRPSEHGLSILGLVGMPIRDDIVRGVAIKHGGWMKRGGDVAVFAAQPAGPAVKSRGSYFEGHHWSVAEWEPVRVADVRFWVGALRRAAAGRLRPLPVEAFVSEERLAIADPVGVTDPLREQLAAELQGLKLPIRVLLALLCRLPVEGAPPVVPGVDDPRKVWIPNADLYAVLEELCGEANEGSSTVSAGPPSRRSMGKTLTKLGYGRPHKIGGRRGRLGLVWRPPGMRERIRQLAGK